MLFRSNVLYLYNVIKGGVKMQDYIFQDEDLHQQIIHFGQIAYLGEYGVIGRYGFSLFLRLFVVETERQLVSFLLF